MFTEVGAVPKKCYIGNMDIDCKELKFYPDRIIIRTISEIIEIVVEKDLQSIFVSSVEIAAMDIDAVGYHVYILCRDKNISGFNPSLGDHHLFDPSSHNTSIKYITALFSVSLSTCLREIYPRHRVEIDPDSAVARFCIVATSGTKMVPMNIMKSEPIDVISIDEDDDRIVTIKEEKKEDECDQIANKRQRIDSGAESFSCSPASTSGNSTANCSTPRNLKSKSLQKASEILSPNYVLFDHIECRYEKIHFGAQRVSFKLSQVESKDCQISVFADKEDIEFMLLTEKYSFISFGLKKDSRARKNITRLLLAALKTWYPSHKFFNIKLERIRIKVGTMVRPSIQVYEIGGQNHPTSILKAITAVRQKRLNQELEQSVIIKGLENLQYLPIL